MMFSAAAHQPPGPTDPAILDSQFPVVLSGIYGDTYDLRGDETLSVNVDERKL